MEYLAVLLERGAQCKLICLLLGFSEDHRTAVSSAVHLCMAIQQCTRYQEKWDGLFQDSLNTIHMYMLDMCKLCGKGNGPFLQKLLNRNFCDLQ